jgi:protein O-GlcNAc transferase
MLWRLVRSFARRGARGADRAEFAAGIQAKVAAGDAAAAEAELLDRLRRDSRQPMLLHLLGLVRYSERRYAEAAQLIERALEQAPDDPDFLGNLGEAQRAARSLDAAEATLRRALTLRPADPRLWVNLAIVLGERGMRQAAIDAVSRAVELEPDDVRARLILAQHLHTKARAAEAIQHLRRALELEPGLPGARFQLHAARAMLCDWAEREAEMIELLGLWDRAPDESAFGDFHPFAAYSVAVPNALRLRLARRYAARFRVPDPPAPRPQASESGRLRVGYLSADFHDHATLHLAAGLFRRHDRRRFEVFAYSFGPDDGSDYRRRFVASVEHFADVRAETAEQTAGRIRADGIHILVDLKGFTFDSRPAILGCRPAPLQVAYLGYPGTMGEGLVDYVLSDAVVTPPGSEAGFGERFALLPHSYQVNDCDRALPGDAPARAECGLPPGAFVFCSFNSPYKIEPRIFSVWMRILSRVPQAVLWVMVRDEAAQANLRREAQARGVDSGRLVFAGYASQAEHLARHAHADLFLDTHFVNAHTTASDALWAGVPVLTCPGDAFPARVAASLLEAAGLPELVAGSLQEYEEIAVSLATDRARLAALKERLTRNRAALPLFDTPRLVENLERAYALMWEARGVTGGAPPFSVLDCRRFPATSAGRPARESG